MKQGYEVVKKIKANNKTFPLSSNRYKTAHLAANEEEKKRYPEGFKKLTRLEHAIKKNELIGHSNKSGKIEVSQKVPPKYRDEVAFHEKIERENILKKPKTE
jgi:hypothetical protein